MGTPSTCVPHLLQPHLNSGSRPATKQASSSSRPATAHESSSSGPATAQASSSQPASEQASSRKPATSQASGSKPATKRQQHGAATAATDCDRHLFRQQRRHELRNHAAPPGRAQNAQWGALVQGICAACPKTLASLCHATQCHAGVYCRQLGHHMHRDAAQPAGATLEPPCEFGLRS